MSKNILLASFIEPTNLESFLNNLKEDFDIPKEKVFIFENENDKSKLIITFKFTVESGNRINFNKTFPNAISIHKRGTAIYTINALNKLIETLHPERLGNLDYKSIKIDWSDYQDKFLLLKNNELTISTIKRIF